MILILQSLLAYPLESSWCKKKTLEDVPVDCGG